MLLMIDCLLLLLLLSCCFCLGLGVDKKFVAAFRSSIKFLDGDLLFVVIAAAAAAATAAAAAAVGVDVVFKSELGIIGLVA